MKMISKIMLGAMLLTTGTVMAQGKSGMQGNKGNNGNKTVIVTERNNPIKSKGSIEANEHASATGRIMAFKLLPLAFFSLFVSDLCRSE